MGSFSYYDTIIQTTKPTAGLSTAGVTSPSTKWKRRIPPSPSNALPKADQQAVGRLCHEGILLAHVQLMSTRTPRAFSAKLLSSWLDPSPYWCLQLFLPKSRILYFPLLNFMRFLTDYFSSLLMPLGIAVQPSGVPTTPKKLCIICKLDEHALYPIFQTSNLKHSWTQYQSQGYTTSLQLGIVLQFTQF